MIDFTKTKKVKTKAKDYRVGRTIYNYSTNSWSVAIKGIGTIPLAGNHSFADGPIILYSTPYNDHHSEWTPVDVNPDVHVYGTAMKYWSKFKPDMKLKGNVINNEFVLK